MTDGGLVVLSSSGAVKFTFLIFSGVFDYLLESLAQWFRETLSPFAQETQLQVHQ